MYGVFFMRRIDKIKLTTVVALLAMCMCLLAISGCGNVLEKYIDYVSELRENIYVASDDDYDIEIITGTREEEFIMDGYCGNIVDYTLVTIEPKNMEDNYNYAVTINGVLYEGEFVKHPFAESLSCDIQVLSTDNVVYLDIIGTKTSSFEAISVKTEDMIDATMAVDIAENTLSSQLGSLKSSNALNAEIYVRLMNNPIDNSGGYYWYVAFIGRSQTVYAVLINPTTMQVVAIRD